MSIPKRTVITLNGSAGAVVSISATIMGCAAATIQECPPGAGAFTGSNFAPQGVNYTLPDDSFTAQFGLNPGDTLEIGDLINKNRAVGAKQITFPDGTSSTATIYAKMKSATVTGTQVLLTEWPQEGN